MRIRPLLVALGLNAVPAVGWFVGDWSAATTLLLYWLETVIGTALVAARIVLHRHLRPSKGHWDYRAPQGQKGQSGQPSSYLSSFLVPATAFTAVHGLFLGALGAMMIAKHHAPETRIDPHALLTGLVCIAFFQLADFAFDMISLRTRPFAWVERVGQLSLSRVVLIHLTIIGGMFAVMATGSSRNFFGVFMFLKAMLNLSLTLPQYQPKTPPLWLTALIDRVPTAKRESGGFAAFWKQRDDEEAARLARNESPIALARSA